MHIMHMCHTIIHMCISHLWNLNKSNTYVKFYVLKVIWFVFSQNKAKIVLISSPVRKQHVADHSIRNGFVRVFVLLYLVHDAAEYYIVVAGHVEVVSASVAAAVLVVVVDYRYSTVVGFFSQDDILQTVLCA